mmetsp:Transcript_29494/g.62661  ORF Transcript_29494/g.62661 Transcript_29494/m.62661 type:complete len:310 (+) Transcript_29494:1798-2727(+)
MPAAGLGRAAGRACRRVLFCGGPLWRRRLLMPVAPFAIRTAPFAFWRLASDRRRLAARLIHSRRWREGLERGRAPFAMASLRLLVEVAPAKAAFAARAVLFRTAGVLGGSARRALPRCAPRRSPPFRTACVGSFRRIIGFCLSASRLDLSVSCGASGSLVTSAVLDDLRDVFPCPFVETLRAKATTGLAEFLLHFRVGRPPHFGGSRGAFRFSPPRFRPSASCGAPGFLPRSSVADALSRMRVPRRHDDARASPPLGDATRRRRRGRLRRPEMPPAVPVAHLLRSSEKLHAGHHLLPIASKSHVEANQE